MSAAAPPLAALPAPAGQDFADWLSPILVKELRQGLKSRVFVGSFIVMQVVMIVTMGLRLLNQSERGTPGGGFDGFFWAMLWLPLLVLMPARGLGAVSEEARANTFDLVQLTRMTAFRIAFGKWVALIAQTLLLVAALLPYAVLRYYFGRVDVLDDLAIIAHLLMASMVLTAGAVALSAAPLAVRILVLAGVLPAMLMGLSGFTILRAVGRSSGGMSISMSPGAPGWWLLPGMTAIYVFMLLEFAAAKFAPPSENHSARKRAAALVLALLTLVGATAGGEDWFDALMLFFVPLVGWVVIEALTERTVGLPTLYTPFARRGPAGRLLGRLLYPGWATAIPFTALVLALIAQGVMIVTKTASPPPSLSIPLVFSTVFFALISPLPVMLFFPRVRQRFWLYVLVQLVFGLFFAAASIAADSPLGGRNPASFHWLAPFPTSALLAMLSHADDASVTLFLSRVTTGCGLVMTAFVCFYMLREFRLLRRLERTALDHAKTPKP